MITNVKLFYNKDKMLLYVQSGYGWDVYYKRQDVVGNWYYAHDYWTSQDLSNLETKFVEAAKNFSQE